MSADPPRSPSRDLTPYVAPDASGSSTSEPRARSTAEEAAFTAQMMGQKGARRGLKGGQPVLKQARSAYLETEFSGSNDRRPPTGLLRKTEI